MYETIDPHFSWTKGVRDYSSVAIFQMKEAILLMSLAFWCCFLLAVGDGQEATSGRKKNYVIFPTQEFFPSTSNRTFLSIEQNFSIDPTQELSHECKAIIFSSNPSEELFHQSSRTFGFSINPKQKLSRECKAKIF
ncbi:hypothetical protein CEXT_486431 [Caerostris extrusa]|uniref:CUB domain-containing protein n=1 Tax=Caerostris extrusa TaxID=172846 RepID=A0AAV4STC8_CAEEX|nr:hypothetical protein CEXT_486431 [Caerostris extrusa]